MNRLLVPWAGSSNLTKTITGRRHIEKKRNRLKRLQERLRKPVVV
jgi:hypothetical protein